MTQIIEDLRHTQEADLEAEINTDLIPETAMTIGRPDHSLNPDLTFRRHRPHHEYWIENGHNHN